MKTLLCGLRCGHPPDSLHALEDVGLALPRKPADIRHRRMHKVVVDARGTHRKLEAKATIYFPPRVS